MAPRFHRNAFSNDAESSPLVHTEELEDGRVRATYADGHTIECDPENDGHAKLAARPLYPGGDRTERKIDALLQQYHHRDD